VGPHVNVGSEHKSDWSALEDLEQGCDVHPSSGFGTTGSGSGSSFSLGYKCFAFCKSGLHHIPVDREQVRR